MGRTAIFILASGQLVLALVFGIAAGYSARAAGSGAGLEQRTAGDLLTFGGRINVFVKDIQSNVPGIRNVGHSLNSASEEQRNWGDPVLKCADDLDSFAESVLKSPQGNPAERAGNFLREERPVSRAFRILAWILGAVAAVFLVNAAVLFRVGAAKLPSHRQ